MAPVIGLTTYAEPARFGLLDTFAAVLPMAYVRAVQEGGGRAVLLPPESAGPEVLERLDGLVLTGGGDVAPERYGAAPHAATRPRPERDEAELVLLRGALAAGLPVLGICRGMQVLAVAAGGRLHQHLPDVLGTARHRPLGGAAGRAAAAGPVSGGAMGEHRVELAPGSRCHRILGGSLLVNSFHHQGVADPGTLTAAGWCADDGLIEVLEDPSRPFVLGVQWHAEEMPDRRLFAALAEAAGAGQGGPSAAAGAPASVGLERGTGVRGRAAHRTRR
jgi:putative glutamine amidotransferase